MSRTLRITLALPAQNAWSETFIAAHIERLEKVDLLVSGGDPPSKASHGAQFARTSSMGRLVDRVIARLHGGMPDLLRYRLARRLAKDRPDVVLAEYGSMAAEIVAACRRAEVPLVVHYHGFDAHREDYIARYGGYREVFEYASFLVVVSRAMERQLLAIGAPREKVVYNCYGIDVDRFVPGDPSEVEPRFLAVGRFAEKKAPQHTIRAFEQVLRARPSARLTMVGQGSLWEQCVALIAELGIGHAVDLVGVRTQAEIAALFHQCRAFVQHSVVTRTNDHEGTPLAVLEAMASGVPVVSTRHAGIMDVVAEGERGLLCDEHDVDAMARHMIELIDDPAKARRMGMAGRAYVEKYHRVEVQVAALQALLVKAVDR